MNSTHAKNLAGVALLSLVSVLLAGCPTAPNTETGKANLTDEATTAVNKFERTDTGLHALLARSAGYAIFPNVGEGGLGVGGSYGKGTLYEGGAKVGYCDISQASIGFQAGGEVYAELLVFQDQESLNKFKTGNFAFSAQAAAVALAEGASTQASFKEGVAVFTQSLKGLMYKAAIAGQKFRYTPA